MKTLLTQIRTRLKPGLHWNPSIAFSRSNQKKGLATHLSVFGASNESFVCILPGYSTPLSSTPIPHSH